MLKASSQRPLTPDPVIGRHSAKRASNFGGGKAIEFQRLDRYSKGSKCERVERQSFKC